MSEYRKVRDDWHCGPRYESDEVGNGFPEVAFVRWTGEPECYEVRLRGKPVTALYVQEEEDAEEPDALWSVCHEEEYSWYPDRESAFQAVVDAIYFKAKAVELPHLDIDGAAETAREFAARLITPDTVLTRGPAAP